jgi:hypothetical protein
MTSTGLFYSVDQFGCVTLLGDSLGRFADDVELPAAEVAALVERGYQPTTPTWRCA